MAKLLQISGVGAAGSLHAPRSEVRCIAGARHGWPVTDPSGFAQSVLHRSYIVHELVHSLQPVPWARD